MHGDGAQEWGDRAVARALVRDNHGSRSGKAVATMNSDLYDFVSPYVIKLDLQGWEMC